MVALGDVLAIEQVGVEGGQAVLGTEAVDHAADGIARRGQQVRPAPSAANQSAVLVERPSGPAVRNSGAVTRTSCP